MDKEQRTAKTGICLGVTKALPIVFGYLPIGIAFGLLANNVGLTAFSALLMSLVVYAGSAQLVAVGLIASGASALSIVFTTFVINLRHLLFSAAVARSVKKWRKPELAAFAYELTDETFAVHTTRLLRSCAPENSLVKTEAFATNVTAQVGWLLGTWIGVALGNTVPDVQTFGLDYVLAAMFIGLLIRQMETTTHVVVCLFSGLFAVGLTIAGAGQWAAMAAALVGATVGVGVNKCNSNLHCT